MEATSLRSCSWCGAEEPARHTLHNGWFKNRRGEWFCCKSHRDQSNRALRRFLETERLFNA